MGYPCLVAYIGFLDIERGCTKMNLTSRAYGTIAAVLLLLSSGCAQKAARPAIEEHDGAELVSLMRGAQQALEEGDAQSFVSLFKEGARPRAERTWKRLYQLRESVGSERIRVLSSFPELERATANVHVERLIPQAFFFFYDPYEGKNVAYQTKWTFTRGGADSGWKLDDLKIERPGLSSGYGQMMKELGNIRHGGFLALEMDWVTDIDPGELLLRTLHALADADMETLKACTIDGTLFYALEKNIEMPTILNDESVSGKYNREQSIKCLKDQIENIKRFANDMEIDPKNLTPYFNAYRILSLPAECKRLKLLIEFDGSSLTESVESFVISWAGARLKGRWLTESMYVESARIRR